jgi:hypothetical protein
MARYSLIRSNAAASAANVAPPTGDLFLAVHGVPPLRTQTRRALNEAALPES